jgi:hypothetical protein
MDPAAPPSSLPPAPMGPPPMPVRAIGYESEVPWGDPAPARALLPLVRTIGLLSVILAPVGVVLVVLGLWVSVRGGAFRYGAIWAWSMVILTPLELITNLLQLLGGIGCLRRRLRGRRLLIVAAWASLALSLCGCVVGAVVSVGYESRFGRADPVEVAYLLTYYLQRSAAAILFSVITLVFLTRRQVAGLFASAA